MSRVPPLKIPRAVMEQIAGMPPSSAGRYLSWGWRCFNGESIFLDEEEMKDPEARKHLSVGADLLDPTALAMNILDVVAFSEARDKERDISRKRAKAREQRFVDKEPERNVVPFPRYADGTPAGNGTNRDHVPFASTPHGRAAVANLETHGVGPATAGQAIERFAGTHGIEAVLSVTERMKGRRVANPVRYLESALRNERADVVTTPALSGPGGAPRPVRKTVAPSKDGAWTFLGWTCLGHPKAGSSVDSRRKAWRTDAGRIVYKPAEEGETPPSFGQDPGICEVE